MSLGSCTVPTKKLRTIESHEDRISNLPEDVISHILSRMPTKDAVQTCILSKEWRFKWTSVDSIDIDATMSEEAEISSLVTFVDRVLDLTRDSRMTSFRLILPKNQEIDKSPDHLTRWIHQVVGRGFRRLEVSADLTPRVGLSTKFLAGFTCLTELYINLNCELELPVNICFPFLKRFYLGCEIGEVRILEKQSPKTGELRLTFPVLEVLYLNNCRFFELKLVEIRAPELFVFKEFRSRIVSDCTFKFLAPKLDVFNSRGYLSKYDLYAPSLRRLELTGLHTGSEILASRASAILKGVPNLEILCLKSPIVDALLEWKEVDKLPTYHRLEQVVFCLCGAKDMLELLELMPNVKRLNCIGCDYEYNEQERPLPRCIISSLKRMAFSFWPDDDSGNIDMIRLFLEKGMKLKEVIVRKVDSAEMSRLLSTLEPEIVSRSRILYDPYSLHT